jgi:hypothetical protein
MVDTIFGGSPEKVIAALLDNGAAKLRREDVDRLSAMIEKAKTEGS